MSTEEQLDLEAMNQATRDAWNQNAEVWDTTQGDDGNQTQRLLVNPASERLLEVQPGQTILEIACGNGVFARQLARLGAQVVATDFSEALLERAKARSGDYMGQIDYRLVDATIEEQLLALGVGRFDAAVANMALMDIATLEPLLAALGKLLKPGGRFVFAVTHPCFNSGSQHLMLEQEDREGEIVTTYSVKISTYLSLGPHKGLAVIGQPAPQYYFDRPLHVLFNSCFHAGFVLDGLEEPAFSPGTQGSRALSFANLTDIPMVLVARMRLL
jgi:2-polyprenyl-3-methyl-5-hydroxy-6-metoxy-1,4-benzoquinol methylase